MTKTILVIGGTGAQGVAVLKALRSADPPFAIRVLTRDPEKPRVKNTFRDISAELVKGNTFKRPLELFCS